MSRRGIPILVAILCWQAVAAVAAQVSAPGSKPGSGEQSEETLAREAERLGKEVVAAGGKEWQTALDSLAKGKGTVYTRALLFVIGKCEGKQRQQARDALVMRLSRMKA